MLTVMFFQWDTVSTQPTYRTVRAHVRTLGADRAATWASCLVCFTWASVFCRWGATGPSVKTRFTNREGAGAPRSIRSDLRSGRRPRAGPRDSSPSGRGRGHSSVQSSAVWSGRGRYMMTRFFRNFLLFVEGRERGRVTRRNGSPGRSNARGDHGRAPG